MKTPNIIYDPAKGIVYDFIVVMIHSQKFSDISSIYAEMEAVPDIEVSLSYKRLQATVKKHSSAMVRLMFYCGESGLSVFSTFYEFLTKSGSIDELIDRLINYDPELYFGRILSFFDVDHKFSLNFYNRIIQDRELLMEYLSGLKMTADVRLAFMNFVEFSPLMLAEFKRDLVSVKKELEAEYEILRQYREDFYAQLKDTLDFGNPDTFYKRYCSSMEALQDTAYEDVRVYATVYVPFAVQYMGNFRTLTTFFGKDFDKYFNTGQNPENDISNIFKAFTDVTRVRTLRLIKKYGSVNYTQLSKELDVPMSSISHHLDILETEGMIKRRNEGKRNFFSISRAGIENAVNILGEFL